MSNLHRQQAQAIDALVHQQYYFLREKTKDFGLDVIELQQMLLDRHLPVSVLLGVPRFGADTIGYFLTDYTAAVNKELDKQILGAGIEMEVDLYSDVLQRFHQLGTRTANRGFGPIERKLVPYMRPLFDEICDLRRKLRRTLQNDAELYA